MTDSELEVWKILKVALNLSLTALLTSCFSCISSIIDLDVLWKPCHSLTPRLELFHIIWNDSVTELAESLAEVTGYGAAESYDCDGILRFSLGLIGKPRPPSYAALQGS